jgi:hypothetical protein
VADALAARDDISDQKPVTGNQIPYSRFQILNTHCSAWKKFRAGVKVGERGEGKSYNIY